MAIKTYQKGDSTKLSENFRAREFDCPGSGCCSTTPIDEKLVTYLQQIRTHFGKPINILAYRCPKHNAVTPNASPNSRHTKGMAADFHIDGVPCEAVAAYAESIGIKGIGLYDTFVHIDTRESKSFWYSHAQEYRATFAGVPVEKTVDTLAREVIAGQHGSGAQRRASLGDQYDAVQARVNELLSGGTTATQKTVDELAREVIAGKHGSGAQRRASLGDQYDAVQKRVNALLGVK